MSGGMVFIFLASFGVGLIAIFLTLIVEHENDLKAEKTQNNPNVTYIIVRPRKSNIAIGIVALFLSGVFNYFVNYVLSTAAYNHWFSTVFFSLGPLLFFVIGSLSIYQYFRWRLIVDGDKLYYRPLWRAIRTFSFDDIVKIEVSPIRGGVLTKLISATGKKICKVDSNYIGSNLLIALLREKEIPYEKIPLFERQEWPPDYDF